jgi:hypothetical protein
VYIETGIAFYFFTSFHLLVCIFSSAKLLLRLLPLGLAAAVICFLCDADGRHEKNLTRAPKKKSQK